MFDLGDVVPLTVQIRDSNGNLANAGNVTLTIGLPDGSSISPTPSNPTTGIYQLDYVTTQAGRHSVRWLATGANGSAFTDGFDVRSADPGYIISLADAKATLNMSQTNTADDEEMKVYLEAVTRVIEDWRNEAVVRRTVVEKIDTIRGVRTVEHVSASYSALYAYESATRQLSLSVTPIIAVSSVSRVDGTYTWDLSQLDVDYNDSTVTVLYGPLFYGYMQVNYVAGYPIVPANYTLAARIIFAHLWELQRAPSIGSGDTLFSRDADVTVPTPSGFAIPNRAAELLGGRPPVIA